MPRMGTFRMKGQRRPADRRQNQAASPAPPGLQSRLLQCAVKRHTAADHQQLLVQHCAVLNVGVVAHFDGTVISAEDGVVPHVDILSQGDVPYDDGTGQTKTDSSNFGFVIINFSFFVRPAASDGKVSVDKDGDLPAVMGGTHDGEVGGANHEVHMGQ